jgi:hypothetical protein
MAVSTSIGYTVRANPWASHVARLPTNHIASHHKAALNKARPATVSAIASGVLRANSAVKPGISQLCSNEPSGGTMMKIRAALAPYVVRNVKSQ